MKPKMRRKLPGTFLARHLGESAWRLSRSEPQPIDVLVLGADLPAAEFFRALNVRDIEVEWRTEAVWLTMISNGRPATVKAQSAIVHEPCRTSTPPCRWPVSTRKRGAFGAGCFAWSASRAAGISSAYWRAVHAGGIEYAICVTRIRGYC